MDREAARRIGAEDREGRDIGGRGGAQARG